MTDDQTLRAVAEAATKAVPGRWRKFKSRFGSTTIAIMQGEEPDYNARGYHTRKWREIVAWPGFDGSDFGKAARHTVARFISTFDPPTVLSLLDRLAAAEVRATTARTDGLREAAEIAERRAALHEEEGDGGGREWATATAIATAIRERAASVGAGSDAWEPIETAPKDGSKFLGYCPSRGIRETYMGRYQEGSPGYALWVKGDGPRNYGWVWIEEVHNSAHTWKPTHWRRIPEPPRSAGRG